MIGVELRSLHLGQEISMLYQENNALPREQIDILRSNLSDKDELIAVYKEQKHSKTSSL